MGLLKKIVGITNLLFQIGIGGPKLKNNAGAIEARDNTDSGFVVIRGANGVSGQDMVTASQMAASRIETFRFVVSGNVNISQMPDGNWIANRAGRIISVRGYLEQAGGSGTLLIDVNINGVTIFTTQASRLSFDAASGDNNKQQSGSIDVAAFSTGASISIDIDDTQTGADAGLSVLIEVEYD